LLDNAYEGWVERGRMKTHNVYRNLSLP